VAPYTPCAPFVQGGTLHTSKKIMGFLSNIFNQIFYQPLLNLLFLLYQLLPGKDFGMAVILLTILIKILLYPLNLKSIRSQKTISELEPKIREIKEKFKDNKEKILKETFEFYQKEKINPLSGFFLILIQIPILFALYKVFLRGVFEPQYLYAFLPSPGEIKPYFFNINLTKPDFLLAFLAGIFHFLQARLFTPLNSKHLTGFTLKSGAKTKKISQFSEIFQKQMLYFFPVFTFFILLKIPSAIALYLIVSTTFSILQTFYVRRATNAGNRRKSAAAAFGSGNQQ